ncbi:hypothetical protein EVAR_102251_1 [Eumeta japonica]|uniref:Uncharacterized protein n=1 Tax=Eumeta variegata TaxID=151549 RepID=A0A4C1WD49_EUMVA|nr:hypothetical protein EVAR_102251_1 [Eumeta japonica]
MNSGSELLFRLLSTKPPPPVDTRKPREVTSVLPKFYKGISFFLEVSLVVVYWIIRVYGIGFSNQQSSSRMSTESAISSQARLYFYLRMVIALQGNDPTPRRRRRRARTSEDAKRDKIFSRVYPAKPSTHVKFNRRKGVGAGRRIKRHARGLRPGRPRNRPPDGTTHCLLRPDSRASRCPATSHLVHSFDVKRLDNDLVNGLYIYSLGKNAQVN